MPLDFKYLEFRKLSRPPFPSLETFPYAVLKENLSNKVMEEIYMRTTRGIKREKWTVLDSMKEVLDP